MMKWRAGFPARRLPGAGPPQLGDGQMSVVPCSRPSTGLASVRQGTGNRLLSARSNRSNRSPRAVSLTCCISCTSKCTQHADVYPGGPAPRPRTPAGRCRSDGGRSPGRIGTTERRPAPITLRVGGEFGGQLPGRGGQASRHACHAAAVSRPATAHAWQSRNGSISSTVTDMSRGGHPADGLPSAVHRPGR